MKYFLALFIIIATVSAQDTVEDYGGIITTGKLIEITNTHIIFSPDYSQTDVPQKIAKHIIKRVVLSDGTVVFEELIQPPKQTTIKDSSLIVNNQQLKPQNQTTSIIEGSMARIAKAHETLALVATIQLGIVVVMLTLSIIIASAS